MLFLLKEGIKSSKEVKSTGKKADTQANRVEVLGKQGKEVDVDLFDMYTSVLILHQNKKFIESIITSSAAMELALRKNLDVTIPCMASEPIENVLSYSKERKLISSSLFLRTIKLFHIKNDIILFGSIPTYRSSKSARSLLGDIIYSLSKNHPKSIKWVASFSILVPERVKLDEIFQTNDSMKDDEVFNRLKDYLLNKLNSDLEYQITEDDYNGESFSIRIAFPWNAIDGTLPFDDPSPWELLELEPYTKVYVE
jgi:hypothetical protein